jgi:hypothetical protein
MINTNPNSDNLEESLLTPPPDFKLYKENSIYPATFLGGPLAAGYIAAENFKHLGNQQKVKTTWVITVLATIAIFAGVFLIPNIEKIPNYLIPLIYTAIAQFIIRQVQGNLIKEHIAKGVQVYSIWRALLIGLVGLAITVAIFLLINLFVD